MVRVRGQQMLKIVESTNRGAVAALLAPERARDAATDRRVAAIVRDVRAHGDEALIRYARKFDRLDGPVEVSRDDMIAGAPEGPAPVRAAIRAAARNIRMVARLQGPRGWRPPVAPGGPGWKRILPPDRGAWVCPGDAF